MKYTKVQTPRGAKDILPPEAYKKSRLEHRAAECVENWGYGRVYTPTFEFYDALAQGDGPEISDTLYRFVDRDGTTLALRPEMTTPIARMAATRYQREEMPLRLYYVGSVFRYDEPQAGRRREFTQVGVELLGADRPAADAEVVTLAVEVLETLGLSSFRVDLGHIAYFHGLLGEIEDDTFATRLKQALLDRDYVGYENLIEKSGMEPRRKKALLALPTLRGNADILDVAETLAAGVPQALEAVENLTAVYDLIRAYGLADRVAIDLGMIKDLHYYSGILLEGYTPELGFTLCTGGRYDTLVGRFGLECPATGFAFGVERTMLALDRQGWNERERRPEVLLFGSDKDTSALFQLAARLRAREVSVEVDVCALTPEEALAYAGRRGIAKVARPVRMTDGEPVVELTGVSGQTWTGSIDEMFSA